MKPLPKNRLLNLEKQIVEIKPIQTGTLLTYDDHAPIQNIFNNLNDGLNSYQAYLEKANQFKANYINQVEVLRAKLLCKLEVVEEEVDVMIYETPNKEQKKDV